MTNRRMRWYVSVCVCVKNKPLSTTCYSPEGFFFFLLHKIRREGPPHTHKKMVSIQTLCVCVCSSLKSKLPLGHKLLPYCVCIYFFFFRLDNDSDFRKPNVREKEEKNLLSKRKKVKQILMPEGRKKEDDGLFLPLPTPFFSI